MRRPALAALLSAVVPGAGQWYAGRPRRAALFLAPAVLLIALGLAGYRRGTFGLIELAVRPDVLRALVGANVLLLGWRIWSVADAYVVAAPREHRTEVARAGLIVLIGLVAVPHLLVGAYALRGIDLIESVFAGDEDVTSTTTATPESVLAGAEDVPRDPQLFYEWYAPIEHSNRNLIFRKDFGDPDAIAVLAEILNPPSMASAPFEDFGERVDPGRLTILLVGGDAGPGRSGLRTDTVMVASIDVDTGKVAIFGLPRNFKHLPLPERFHDVFVDLEIEEIRDSWFDADGDGYPDQWIDEDEDGIPDEPDFTDFESCDCYADMLNTIHGRTAGWTSSYPSSPDPGMSALRDVVEELIQVDIDYFVLVDMAAFVRGIDAIGGVDVMVEAPMHVTVSAPWEGSPKATVAVEPGMNHLNGFEALAFSRWRIGSSDYARMERQRCLVRAAVAQADPATLLRNFHRIAGVIEDYVVTDIPRSFLPDFVRIAGRIDFTDIATVGLVPPTYHDGRAPGGYPIPDVDRIRAKVRQVLADGVTAQSRTGESECGI